MAACPHYPQLKFVCLFKNIRHDADATPGLLTVLCGVKDSCAERPLACEFVSRDSLLGRPACTPCRNVAFSTVIHRYAQAHCDAVKDRQLLSSPSRLRLAGRDADHLATRGRRPICHG